MRWKLFLLGIVSFLAWNSAAQATFVSGSTGADGAFNPTTNTVLQLPPDGIFNFTTVNIPSGVTVTFTKNVTNTPVYILATGNVTITGAISVNGTNPTSTEIGQGGPGGFDGGYGGPSYLSGGKGQGTGGGNPGIYTTSEGGGGGGGGFGTNGFNGTYGNFGTGGLAYGNARLLPLIGGSGGGGGGARSTTNVGRPAGGGGGAIVIASSTSITITGSITANGGSASTTWPAGGGGSGGAIKLVSNVITGNGTITATGGISNQWGGGGGAGRIRIEATSFNRTAATDPPYSYGLPSSVFVSNISSLSVTSIAGTNVPASPTGSYSQPDMMLPGTTTNPVTVNVAASNIPVGTSVKVRVLPQYGNENNATSTLSGTDASSTATVNVNLSTTYSNVVTAEATFTIVGMFYDGEEIDRVRVAANLGGESETTYITKSGKEIKGEMLAMVVRK